MNKTLLIIKREFLTRVKKKSFIVMTILGPLLIAGLMIAVIWFGMKESDQQFVLVVDDTNPVFSELKSSASIKFEYSDMSLEQAQNIFYESDYTSILYIPENILSANTAKLYFKKQPGVITIKSVENQVENIIEEQKLLLYNVDRETYDKINTDFILDPFKLEKSGKQEAVDSSKAWVGFGFGLLIYMFIFLYGVQVMRGVIEEKTSRIIEVIISSVKPFQLMLGKIIGVAMVGLTQFLLWVILTITIVTAAQVFFFTDMMDPAVQAQMTTEMMEQMQQSKSAQFNLNDPNNIVNRTDWGVMLGLFLFYFLGGYLLYSAMFAAIGAAVDNETDSQQFILPVSLPLIIAYTVSTMIVNNPEGPAAFWFSIIPLTSPVVMLVRVAIGIGDGGVPYWEVGLSMGLLVIGFLLTTWLAAKIYRTGILMYGKKVNYKELWKWLRYSS
ncbi:MAG: ABC transporter permease [Flavobacteriales bacterium]|nr:MAG: ABC transporter permease [Flavobacteriales bacterium]